VKNPTPEQVKALWRHMSERFGSQVRDKTTAEEMKLIGSALELMGVLKKDEFLTRFITTIGNVIYTPFTVGVPTPGHDLWGQMVICAHEHQHIVQSNESPSFPLEYLFDPTLRAAYEGAAYRVSMTLVTWLTGHVPAVEPFVQLAKSYGLDEKHLEFFRKYLEISSPTLAQGGVPDKAAKEAIAWLNDHASELKN